MATSKSGREHWLQYIPRWLVAVSAIIFLIVFIERT